MYFRGKPGKHFYDALFGAFQTIWTIQYSYNASSQVILFLLIVS